MNANPANNQNSQWEVDRYLLSDPSLDRDAFEQRMLEESSLAEQVASSVADLQAISSAASAAANAAASAFATSASAIRPQPASMKPTAPSAKGWALLISAAAVLLAFSVWHFSSTPSDEQLSQIADSWVAIEGLNTAESLELVTSEEPSVEIHAEAEAIEQYDWLVEAAREFYLAKNDGAAG